MTGREYSGKYNACQEYMGMRRGLLKDQYDIFCSAALRSATNLAGIGTVDDILADLTFDPRIQLLRGTLHALVRRDGRDLTVRQLTVFLTVQMTETMHTVGSLAELLPISRPAETRIMDRLIAFDLIAREEDREDRRRVLARRTAAAA